jgi:beta-aspartyl-peptidase (threonine type)
VVAYDLSSLIEHKGLALTKAADEVVHRRMIKIGGDGGLICVDGNGNIAMPFNTEGMYRAAKDSDGLLELSIYKD